MRRNAEWFSTRWFEFRHGYTTYMTFLFGFSNFILILYNFVPEVKEFIALHYFAIIVFGVIVPVAVIIGRWHHRRHLPTESKVAAKYNEYRDKVVPDSKENFANVYNIFMTDYAKYSLGIQEKQMKMMNALMDKLDGPLKFDDELKQIEGWQKQLSEWRERFEKYNKGANASELV